MKALPQLCAALLAGLLATSCLIAKDTANEPLHAVELGNLKPGVTTAAEVAELLGAPNEVVQLGLRSAWRYDYTTSKRAGFTIIVVTFSNIDARQDRIWVFFDENSVLSYFGSTLQADNARYAMPWQKVEPSTKDGEEQD